MGQTVSRDNLSTIEYELTKLMSNFRKKPRYAFKKKKWCNLLFYTSILTILIFYIEIDFENQILLTFEPATELNSVLKSKNYLIRNNWVHTSIDNTVI